MILYENNVLRIRQLLKIDTQYCKLTNFRELFLGHRCSSATLIVSYTEHHILQVLSTLSRTWNVVSRDTSLCLLAIAIFHYWFFALYFGEISHAVAYSEHNLYVGVVENSSSSPLTGKQYRNMEPEYPEDVQCHSVLRPQGVFNVPLLFYYW